MGLQIIHEAWRMLWDYLVGCTLIVHYWDRILPSFDWSELFKLADFLSKISSYVIQDSNMDFYISWSSWNMYMYMYANLLKSVRDFKAPIHLYYSTAIVFFFHTNTCHQTEAGRESRLVPFHELRIVIISLWVYTLLVYISRENCSP